MASVDEMVTPTNVVEESMKPIAGENVKDGVYEVVVDSSSSMFKIVECELTVENGMMFAVMTMSGQGYSKVYMGTPQELSYTLQFDSSTLTAAE